MEHKKGFEQWALVEVMGHQRIAGHVTEEEIGGSKFVRVDVPEDSDGQPMTKYLGSGAIYAITPVSEETARALARQIDARPVSVWDARRLVENQKPAAPQLAGTVQHDYVDEPEGDDNILF